MGIGLGLPPKVCAGFGPACGGLHGDRTATLVPQNKFGPTQTFADAPRIEL